MRSSLWFYLFWLVIILALGYTLFHTLFLEKNPAINAFETEMLDTDTIENIIEYPRDSLVPIDRLVPIIIPKSGYVVKGDTFEAQIILAGFIKNVPDIPRVSVNGRRVSFNQNGIGYYSEKAMSYGKKRLQIVENVRSNLTGEKMKGVVSYEYFVGMKEDEWKELSKLQQEIRQGNVKIKEDKIEELRQYYLNKNNK